jgi:hypothetical protein
VGIGRNDFQGAGLSRRLLHGSTSERDAEPSISTAPGSRPSEHHSGSPAYSFTAPAIISSLSFVPAARGNVRRRGVTGSISRSVFCPSRLLTV